MSFQSHTDTHATHTWTSTVNQFNSPALCSPYQTFQSISDCAVQARLFSPFKTLQSWSDFWHQMTFVWQLPCEKTAAIYILFCPRLCFNPASNKNRKIDFAVHRRLFSPTQIKKQTLQSIADFSVQHRKQSFPFSYIDQCTLYYLEQYL